MPLWTSYRNIRKIYTYVRRDIKPTGMWIEKEASGHERRIIVDADACPSLSQIIAIGRENGVDALLVGSKTQNLKQYKNR